jgi:hypothetical protein
LSIVESEAKRVGSDGTGVPSSGGAGFPSTLPAPPFPAASQNWPPDEWDMLARIEKLERAVHDLSADNRHLAFVVDLQTEVLLRLTEKAKEQKPATPTAA